MENNILDHEVSSPHEIRYAGFWDRVGASLIDFLVMIPVIVLTYVNAVNWKSLLFQIVLSFAYIFYKVYMEGTYGATIGKRSIKLKIVNVNNDAITMQKSLMRNSLYIINALLGLAGTIAIFKNPDFEDITGWMEYGKFQNANNMMIENLFSLILFISILFVAFDSKKQSLHDKIAQTYCIKE